jgi:chitinase
LKAEAPITHPTAVVVKLGKHDLSVDHERGSEIKYPSEILIHPDWKPQELRYDADLAALFFDTPVTLSSSIIPICLWFKLEPLTQNNGIVVGWGKSESAANHENTPKELELFIRTNEECFLRDDRFALVSSTNTFCAGKDNHSGPCKGDSGSGLFVRSGAGKLTRWYLRGLVSIGFTEHGRCDVAVDVIFTDLLKFTKWINQIAAAKQIALPKPPVSKNDQKNSLTKRKSNKEIFCFFESWAEGREGDSFGVDNLKPELCTTLVFLLARLEGENLASINPQQTDDTGHGMYKKFTKLKKNFPHLRTLLAVGGWNEGSERYSKLAASEERRKLFARNSASFLKSYNFDGLHFHWEHPAHRGGAPEDKENFVKLLREIKNVYEPEDLYLSVFMRTQTEVVEKAYDLRGIGEIVDAALVMTFDYTWIGSPTIAFPARIRGEGADTVEDRIKYFIKSGVPAEKIILGIPFFGIPFTTEQEGNFGDKTLDGNGFQGPFYHFPFFIGFNEICHLKRNREWKESFYANASQTIIKFETNGQTQVVVYDSPRTVANKVKFMMDNKLGGVWNWFTTSDDARGECAIDETTFADIPQANINQREANDFQLSRTIYEAMEALAPRRLLIPFNLSEVLYFSD